MNSELARALGDGEFFADFSARLRAPHAPECDALWHGRLRAPEIEKALAALEGKEGEEAARGRLKRLRGDADSARRDLDAALARDPENSLAAVWRSELDLERPAATARLDAVLKREPGHELALLHRGASLLLRRRARAARADLEFFVRARPESGIGHLLLGLARRASGGKADEEFKRAAAAAVWSAPHLLRAASLRGAATAAAVEDALDVDPNMGLIAGTQYQPDKPLEPALLALGRIARASPEKFATFDGLRGLYRPLFPPEQLAACLRLTELRPERAWTWALLGRARVQGVSDPEFIRLGLDALDRAAALKPEAGWIFSWRAQGLIAAREPEKALADLDACLRLQPHYHRAYAWRGTLLRQLGREREALADLDRAVALDPLYHFGWRQRALARRACGDWCGAAEDLGRAYGIKPKYEWDRGAKRGEEDWKACAAELDAALAAAPRPAALLAWRGRVKLRLADDAGALVDFSSALEADPACFLARAWRGQALMKAGRRAEASAELGRALETAPNFWPAYDWRARALFEDGRDDAAFAVLRAALRARPNAPWAHALTAEFHMRRGRLRDAAREAETTVGIDGQHGPAHILAADALLKLGDRAGARRHAERAQRLSPEAVELARIRAELDAPPTPRPAAGSAPAPARGARRRPSRPKGPAPRRPKPRPSSPRRP